MSTVFYVQASPKGTESFSIAAANAFIESYRKKSPDDEIVTINVFDRDLPPFDGKILGAKYAILHGRSPSEDQKEDWVKVEAIIDEFKAADKYVFAVPMWNFGLPYRFKQYLDILIQPGYTFQYSPEEGYKGLLPDRPVFVAYARGGSYPRGSEVEYLDFQVPYFKTLLNFIGLRKIEHVIIDSTLGTQQGAGANLDNAIRKATEIAENF